VGGPAAGAGRGLHTRMGSGRDRGADWEKSESFPPAGGQECNLTLFPLLGPSGNCFGPKKNGTDAGGMLRFGLGQLFVRGWQGKGGRGGAGELQLY